MSEGISEARVLVELRVPKGEPAASFDMVQEFDITGFDVDRDYEPVPMDAQPGVATDVQSATEEIVVVRGTVVEDEWEKLKNQENVVAVHSDAEIELFAVESPQPRSADAELSYSNFDLDYMEAFPVRQEDAELTAGETTGTRPIPSCDCQSRVPEGTIKDVAQYLGVDQIWNAGYRGRGMRIGVVDAGIMAQGRGSEGEIPRVVDGWPSDWGANTAGQHGNMVATDVLGMAPESQPYDLRISVVREVPSPMRSQPSSGPSTNTGETAPPTYSLTVGD